MDDDSEATSLLSVKYTPSPDTLSSQYRYLFIFLIFDLVSLELVKRLRALTLTLLPVEVSPTSLSEPTSRIITPQVIAAYRESAGDFVEAVSETYYVGAFSLLEIYIQLPYCLLRARAEFMFDADHNPADYGENYGRGALLSI